MIDGIDRTRGRLVRISRNSLTRAKAGIEFRSKEQTSKIATGDDGCK